MMALAIARPSIAQEVGAPNLTGRVATTGGTPISGVDVRIDGSNAVARSDENGAYRFTSVPAGMHVLRFRRIGFLPGTLAVSVPSMSDSITIMMIPARTTLDTVRVRARVFEVGGIVVDSRNRPVAGATIDVIGGTAVNAATADAGGWFNFTPVRRGPLIIKARKAGYVEATYSLDVEDSRGIVLHMEDIPPGVSEAKAIDVSGFGNNEQFIWEETQQRMARRDARSRIVSREDLAAFSGQQLGDAIRMLNVGTAVRTELAASNDQACVLEDGFRIVGYTTLEAFAADDVDFVELYPAGTESSGSVQRYLRNAGCRAVGQMRAKGPFYAVIWFR